MIRLRFCIYHFPKAKRENGRITYKKRNDDPIPESLSTYTRCSNRSARDRPLTHTERGSRLHRTHTDRRRRDTLCDTTQRPPQATPSFKRPSGYYTALAPANTRMRRARTHQTIESPHAQSRLESDVPCGEQQERLQALIPPSRDRGP